MTLVFTTRRVLVFLKFFYRKYYSFRRCFDLKAEGEKLPCDLFSEREKF